MRLALLPAQWMIGHLSTALPSNVEFLAMSAWDMSLRNFSDIFFFCIFNFSRKNEGLAFQRQSATGLYKP